MVSHRARDRARGRKFPLESMVRRRTRETAERFGMFDRGLVAPRLEADLDVIDFDRLRLRGAGDVATMVSRTVGSQDEPTGALPGGLVRGPQSPATLAAAIPDAAAPGRPPAPDPSRPRYLTQAFSMSSSPLERLLREPLTNVSSSSVNPANRRSRQSPKACITSPGLRSQNICTW